jgi:methylated-DNA-[protein]-cysteine S-methyltransferase
MRRNLLQAQTSLGHFAAFFSEAGLIALTCPYPSPRRALEALVAELPQRIALASCPPPASLAARLARWLQRYARGQAPPLSIPLDGRGLSAFDQRVLSALWHVPFGCVVTYGALAAACGAPGAARAVGQALGRNRSPVLLPCHRVVAANGLGGFGAGLDLKRMLLRHEGLDPQALQPAKSLRIADQGGPQWCAG